MLCGWQKSTENLIESGCMECWCDILSVSIWQEAFRSQSIAGHNSRGEYHTEGHRSAVLQQANGLQRGKGQSKIYIYIYL